MKRKDGGNGGWFLGSLLVHLVALTLIFLWTTRPVISEGEQEETVPHEKKPHHKKTVEEVAKIVREKRENRIKEKVDKIIKIEEEIHKELHEKKTAADKKSSELEKQNSQERKEKDPALAAEQQKKSADDDRPLPKQNSATTDWPPEEKALLDKLLAENKENTLQEDGEKKRREIQDLQEEIIDLQKKMEEAFRKKEESMKEVLSSEDEKEISRAQKDIMELTKEGAEALNTLSEKQSKVGEMLKSWEAEQQDLLHLYSFHHEETLKELKEGAEAASERQDEAARMQKNVAEKWEKESALSLEMNRLAQQKRRVLQAEKRVISEEKKQAALEKNLQRVKDSTRVKQAEKNYQDALTQLKNAQQKISSAENAVEQAKGKKEEREKALAAASQNRETAESAVEKSPQGRVEGQKLRQALQGELQKKRELAQASQSLTKVTSQLTQAKGRVSSSEQQVTRKKDSIEEAKARDATDQKKTAEQLEKQVERLKQAQDYLAEQKEVLQAIKKSLSEPDASFKELSQEAATEQQELAIKAQRSHMEKLNTFHMEQAVAEVERAASETTAGTEATEQHPLTDLYKKAVTSEQRAMAVQQLQMAKRAAKLKGTSVEEALKMVQQSSVKRPILEDHKLEAVAENPSQAQAQSELSEKVESELNSIYESIKAIQQSSQQEPPSSPSITDSPADEAGDENPDVMTEFHWEVDYTVPKPDTENLLTKALPGRKIYRHKLPVEWLFIDSWHYTGPFDNTDRKNQYTAFPPEFGVNLDASYDGKNGKMKWSFHQSPHCLVQPPNMQEESIYYAYTELWFDLETTVHVSVGADDCMKFWINEQHIYTSPDAMKEWGPAEAVIPIKFKKGYNRILYRIENGPGEMAFSMALKLSEN